MKLADITAAATKKFPHLTVEVEVDGEIVEIVFRNLVMTSEEERAKFNAAMKKASESIDKTKKTNVRKIAELSKTMLTQVVKDKEHIELLEEAFSQDPETRDAKWMTVSDAYGEQTQLGEA